jgi:putative transposase
MQTFIYKLRPSPAQALLFAETLETCRRLYNYALAERKTTYAQRGETLAFAHQCATLPQLKQTWHDLKRVHSQVLQDVLHRLQHAFDGFFRRQKAGQTSGYPRFRGKGWYDSFTYRQWANGAHLERARLVLSKIGAVRRTPQALAEGVSGWLKLRHKRTNLLARDARHRAHKHAS